jgi:hypothetical protein
MEAAKYGRLSWSVPRITSVDPSTDSSTSGGCETSTYSKATHSWLRCCLVHSYSEYNCTTRTSIVLVLGWTSPYSTMYNTFTLNSKPFLEIHTLVVYPGSSEPPNLVDPQAPHPLSPLTTFVPCRDCCCIFSRVLL